MSGFYLMHRGWQNNPALRDDFSRKDAWVWLIENACWRQTRFDVRGKTVALERGELCASRDQLAKAWDWSPSAVERFLTRLETEQMIERETGQGRTIITICNYEIYQDVNAQPGQPTGQPTGQKSDRNRTTKEQGNKETRDTTDVVSRDAGARATGNTDGKSPKPKPSAQQQQPVIPDWIPTESWDGFVAMRKSTKNPLSAHGVKLAIRELEKLRRDGHDPGAVLDQSTLQNWRGLFPIKDNHRGNQNGTATPRTGTGQQLGTDEIRNTWLKACVVGANGGPDGAGPGSDGGYQDFAGPDWP